MMAVFKAISVFILLVFAGCNKNTDDDGSDNNSQQPKPSAEVVIEVVKTGLSYPWGLAVLPGGDLLFTERSGKIHQLNMENKEVTTLVSRTVQQNGEGGCLGIAVDPDFASNHFIYVYETATSNQITRFRLENGQLNDEKVIFSGIPKANNHDGGAIRFGPDGYLYAGTGDAQQGELAQDINSLAGKILRIDRDGHPAPGNPFGNAVWAYGMRNVQGLTWTEDAEMLATDHGPSGENGWCCHDEVNLIKKGQNYGWPLVIGDTRSDTLIHSLAHSGTDTWAPSGCTYLGPVAVWPNTLVVACLRGSRLERFVLSSGEVSSRRDTLNQTYGRLRNVIEAPDGSIVFCTSNGDDGIYRISRK